MPKPAEKTTLYRLIEAGHLARQKMLVPLTSRGLETGDDAMLFGIDETSGATERQLQDLTGLNDIALEMRLVRLSDDGFITRAAVGPNLRPGAKLTERGIEIANILNANWQELEQALTGELDHKDRKSLRKILKRFVTLLDF